MELPKIDETKLPAVMKIIDDAACLMEETGCAFDKEKTDARKKLDALQKELVRLTGKDNLDITSFMEYWSYTDLETVAKKALLPAPVKSGLSDEELTKMISEMITALNNGEFEDEATMDYFMEKLETETGLTDFSDYIFYPDVVGLDPEAGVDEVVAKILADRKNAVIHL